MDCQSRADDAGIRDFEPESLDKIALAHNNSLGASTIRGNVKKVPYGKLKYMKVRDVIKRLEEDGWYFVKTEGSHRQFKHPIKRGRTTVAGKMSVDVPIGTLKSIWRQAQLSEDK